MANIDNKDINKQNSSMESGNTVLCAANSYNQKFFMNPEYNNLPEDVLKELKIISVEYTEEVGGIFLMEFNRDSRLVLKSMHEDGDVMFDEDNSRKKIDSIAEKYEALFTKLETYYKAIQALHGNVSHGESEIVITEEDEKAEPGANNPTGIAEVRRATSEEMSALDDHIDTTMVSEEEQGSIRMTGSWDMPVHPDDPDAENTAYHTLFGD
ncbi:DUF6145 family protein [Oribacterium sp. WCC10]|uniref:DUF6145 family protein n=1 Tax=Oribacterium sp. WCC10 TaxID=1855343 RepID=UPI0008E69F2F|nr:DUF6145 family protein [Oribacterium sp. WCC10]SFG84346.1 hypothetical protein SAMN05216356_1474 [Oribacterium sp. WCC10]